MATWDVQDQLLVICCTCIISNHCVNFCSIFVPFLVEEAALRLGQDREFVTRLVEWSACEEHPGVKGWQKVNNVHCNNQMF